MTLALGFEFIDSSFEEPRPYLQRSDGIVERKIIVSYGVDMRAESIQRIEREQFQRLKQSGLVSVFLGAESFDQATLVSIKNLLMPLRTYNGYKLTA